MRFALEIYLLTFSLFAFYLSAPPEPISLHAPLLDQTEEGNPHPGQSLPPLKISTGRMKPISSVGSPRYEEATMNAGIGSNKYIKSVTHVGILPYHESEYLYPKLTVKPGRKDSTVVSVFAHTPSDFKDVKPYEYLQHQQKDSIADISRPADFYKVGYRKGHYNPKAALISTVPGDIRAKQKRPTIEIDPGKYHGNLVTSICGPYSPTKRGCGAVPINNPTRSRSRSRSTSPDGGSEGKRRRVS